MVVSLLAVSCNTLLGLDPVVLAPADGGGGETDTRATGGAPGGGGRPGTGGAGPRGTGGGGAIAEGGAGGRAQGTGGAVGSGVGGTSGTGGAVGTGGAIGTGGVVGTGGTVGTGGVVGTGGAGGGAGGRGGTGAGGGEVHPVGALTIRLTWNAWPDMDLHFIKQERGLFCVGESTDHIDPGALSGGLSMSCAMDPPEGDCYWGNPTPLTWMNGGNPRISADVKTGFGPETVTVGPLDAGNYLASVALIDSGSPVGGVATITINGPGFTVTARSATQSSAGVIDLVRIVVASGQMCFAVGDRLKTDCP
jgi:hypothetical protein